MLSVYPYMLRDLNYAPIWRGYKRVWEFDVYHPSFDRWLYLFLHRLRKMGSFQRQIMESLICPEMTVLDLGGNIGLYTALFSKCVGPQGKVISFEPVPELYQALLRTVERNHFANVTVYPYAAGSKDDQVEIALDPFNSGNNWISPAARKTSVITVPVRRVDSLMMDRPPDFVKIDVQGWEVEALQGMTGLMERATKPIIFCEVSESSLRAAGSSTRELGQFLLEHGYQLTMPVPSQEKKGKAFACVPLDLEALVAEAQKTSYFDILARSPANF